MKSVIASKEIKTFQSLIAKLGKSGVEYIVKHNELPAIKLSQEEMKFLNGGTKFIIEWNLVLQNINKITATALAEYQAYLRPKN